MKKQKCLSKWLRYDAAHCFETFQESTHSLSHFFREISSLQLPVTRVHKRKAPSPAQKQKTNTLLNYFSKKQKTAIEQPLTQSKSQQNTQPQQQQSQPLTRRVYSTPSPTNPREGIRRQFGESNQRRFSLQSPPQAA